MADGLPRIQQAVYGDKVKLEHLAAGLKTGPGLSTPQFTDRVGGRPRGAGVRPAAPRNTPAAPAIPPEHVALMHNAASAIYNAQYLQQIAQMPGADPRFALLAQAAVETAKGHAHAMRTGTPSGFFAR